MNAKQRTDLEITWLCAEALELPYGIERIGEGPQRVIALGISGYYDPLHDDAQAMSLVKKLKLFVRMANDGWLVLPQYQTAMVNPYGCNTDLNRAICECVAHIQAAK